MLLDTAQQSGPPTLSPASAEIIWIATEEATSAAHPQVEPQHLLLALLKAPDNPATRLLAASGLTVEKVLDQIRSSGGGPSQKGGMEEHGPTGG